MRLVVVCLLLLCSPRLAQASGVRLLTESVRLELSWPYALPSAKLELTVPCLACHLGSFAKGPAELAARLPSGTAGVARRAKVKALPAPRRVVAVGDSWQLGHGRELSIRLTPTQEECAPLMRLKF
jgi:hypothetical protein